jgi:DNA-directed RNA polymerase specialized sigma24 family protein
VIETDRGAEEFVFQDRVLVRRTMGAKHRRLVGGCDVCSRSTRAVEWLGKALLRLPFEQRTALELVYHAGYSCEEVGEITGCPASTVKTRMFHARRKLRLALPMAAGLDNRKRRVSAA